MAVAVVTGASRGIGRATAIALGRAGFAVGLIARTDDDLAETARAVAAQGARAVPTTADVTDPGSVRSSIAEVEHLAGPINVLVNNAGSLRAIGPLWEIDAADFWTDVETSLGGAFNLCRAVVPGMIERGGGRIVNVTSYAGMRPAPYQTGYGCGKSALGSLTESLAASLSRHGVKVFGFAPGFTRTDMTDHLTGSEQGRRWLPDAGTARVVEAELSAEAIVRLATGGADELNGRFLHALDDVENLLDHVDEIARDDLYVPRLRRLSDRG